MSITIALANKQAIVGREMVLSVQEVLMNTFCVEHYLLHMGNADWEMFQHTLSIQA